MTKFLTRGCGWVIGAWLVGIFFVALACTLLFRLQEGGWNNVSANLLTIVFAAIVLGLPFGLVGKFANMLLRGGGSGYGAASFGSGTGTEPRQSGPGLSEEEREYEKYKRWGGL